MSKASEYAKQVNNLIFTINGATIAFVSASGHFDIRQHLMADSQAIELAKWIIETFSDNPKETCEQWAKELK